MCIQLKNGKMWKRENIHTKLYMRLYELLITIVISARQTRFLNRHIVTLTEQHICIGTPLLLSYLLDTPLVVSSLEDDKVIIWVKGKTRHLTQL